MSIHETNELKKEVYTEALRYIDNAEENLKKANKEGNRYSDAKYVRIASAVAYNAVLITLDALLQIKGIYPKKQQRKSIEWYRYELRKIDIKLLNEVNDTYDILHLCGYYDGLTNVQVIETGMKIAKSVIKRIKPVVN